MVNKSVLSQYKHPEVKNELLLPAIHPAWLQDTSTERWNMLIPLCHMKEKTISTQSAMQRTSIMQKERKPQGVSPYPSNPGSDLCSWKCPRSTTWPQGDSDVPGRLATRASDGSPPPLITRPPIVRYVKQQHVNRHRPWIKVLCMRLNQGDTDHLNPSCGLVWNVCRWQRSHS